MTSTRIWRFSLAVVFLVGGGLIPPKTVTAQGKPSAAPSSSATATVKKVPPRPAEPCCGYSFPRETDAEIAAGDVHRVLHEDEHVMLMEVANPPLLHVKMHGHPYSSVFANDSAPGPRDPQAPNVPQDQINPLLDPKSPYNEMGATQAAAPAGLQWPRCMPGGPQAPHEGPFNTSVAPFHFYRLEFLRAEGDDYQQRWKEWYPEMTQPVTPVADLTRAQAGGPKMSEQWPYPIAYDSIHAAPHNYRLLYEDEKLRLVEVMVRPGETTPMHGNPYPAVVAVNGSLGDPSLVTRTWLDPKSPLNGQGGGYAGPPKVHNLKSPSCSTMAPVSPHKIHNAGKAPLHYYRIEYKRIDGDQLPAKWKTWYPWMQFMHFAH